MQVAMITLPAGTIPIAATMYPATGASRLAPAIRNCMAPKTAARRSTGTSSTNRHSKLGSTTYTNPLMSRPITKYQGLRAMAYRNMGSPQQRMSKTTSTRFRPKRSAMYPPNMVLMNWVEIRMLDSMPTCTSLTPRASMYRGR